MVGKANSYNFLTRFALSPTSLKSLKSLKSMVVMSETFISNLVLITLELNALINAISVPRKHEGNERNSRIGISFPQSVSPLGGNLFFWSYLSASS